MQTKQAHIIQKSELLAHWQGHRALTRRVIEAFPEKEFFGYSIGGMRTFSAMTQELLGIAVPALREIVTGKTEALEEHDASIKTKADVLSKWDQSTAEINRLWEDLPEERFPETVKTFGQYEGTVWSSIFYFIDNEIHHRGQGYVYLRALGIEPPYFWERE
jgi:uncharacterized damage-inducible protein DinB